MWLTCMLTTILTRLSNVTDSVSPMIASAVSQRHRLGDTPLLLAPVSEWRVWAQYVRTHRPTDQCALLHLTRMPGGRLRLSTYNSAVEREIAPIKTRRGPRYILRPTRQRPAGSSHATPPRMPPTGFPRPPGSSLLLDELADTEFTFRAPFPIKSRMVSGAVSVPHAHCLRA